MKYLAQFTNLSKKKIYISLAVIAAASLFLVGVFWVGRNQAATVSQDVALVRVSKIGATGMNPNYTYSGEVRGRYESQLAFQVGGKIIKRYVDSGKRVQAGEPLMQMNPKDIQQTVNIGSAQVYSAESQLKLAGSNLARYRKLYEQNAISQMQYEQVLNAYEAAQASVNAASAQYVQGANQLDYTTLYADSDGVIAGIDAEAGQVVGAGQNVVTLVKDGELEVEINVPENRIEEVRKAGMASISFWALPNIKVDGKIREVSPMADKVTRTYRVRISLLNSFPEIKLGMTATVTMAGPGQQSALYIPLSAIYQDKEKPSVWVVNGNAVNLRPIVLGAFGDTNVQVLAGLNYGETIVTAGVHKLREGQIVRIAGDGQ